MAEFAKFKRSAIRNQDEIKVCPYDSAHMILESRLQYHLARCSKQNQTKDILICPFNASHHIPSAEMLRHSAECPDKKLLDVQKYQSEDEMADKSLPKYIPPPLPPSEENWDEEEVQSTYEPEKHLGSKCVFRNLQGASKSERKKFRMEERRRVAQLISANPESEPPKPEIPVRPPKSLPKAMEELELDSRLGMGRGTPPAQETEEESAFKWKVVGKKKGGSHQGK